MIIMIIIIIIIISDYFFISSRLALKRPEMIESYFILSYRSPYPSNQFNTNNETIRSSIRPHGVLGSLTLLYNVIKAAFFRIALAPAIVQDIILDFLKPLIPVGAVFIYLNIERVRLLYVCVGVIGIIIIISIYYCCMKSSRVLPINNTGDDHDIMYNDHYESLKMPPPPKNPGTYPTSLDDEKADDGQSRRQAPPPNSIGSHPILVQKILVKKTDEVEASNNNNDNNVTPESNPNTAALLSAHLAKVSAQLFDNDDDRSSLSSDDSFI